MFREINNLILKTAPKHEARLIAPISVVDLMAYRGSRLVVWSGASDDTIFGDRHVNWAFRALHDQLHLLTRIGFSPNEEIELARIQANQYEGLMADLVYIEVAGQAEYFAKTGRFVSDQVSFTLNELKKRGYVI